MLLKRILTLTRWLLGMGPLPVVAHVDLDTIIETEVLRIGRVKLPIKARVPITLNLPIKARVNAKMRAGVSLDL